MSGVSVEFRGVSKSFGEVLANDDLSFSVKSHTIHAIVGENGAGKSTAMKLLYGMISPDKGDIFLRGKLCSFRSARDAVNAGIGMVHQHFMLAHHFSVLDNIILGRERSSQGFLFLPEYFRPTQRNEARKKLNSIIAENPAFAVDLDAKIHELPVGLQQRVEILKLLYQNSEVLILDEPTAVLTPPEIHDLMENLKRLKALGKSILIITHKLKEVMENSDFVTVMRAGKVVATVATPETNSEQLAEFMVGRHVTLPKISPRSEDAKPLPRVLEIKELTFKKTKSTKASLNQISIHIGVGEIVGIAGVEGNGQDELISYLNAPINGANAKVFNLNSQTAAKLSTVERHRAGMSFIAPDRHAQAMLLQFDLQDNFLLGHSRSKVFSFLGWLKLSLLRERVAKALEIFDVRPRSASAKANSLSGGNQQKLVIARAFETKPKLLVAAHPTRGVDIGAIEFIHQKMLDARDAGVGILLISSELDEIMRLSDRIYVLYEGKIAAEFLCAEATEQKIGIYMAGGKQ